MRRKMPSPPVAIEGKNCWRRAHAHRTALLVDAESYYAALAEAFERAQRSIVIVGWDIHSRIRLLRDERPHDLPVELGEMLNALAHRRRKLHVYVLDWDFAMIYALDREALPMLQLGWRMHRRVHFRLDAEHPLGGSQHQKLVVVDDAVAFVGGIDLAANRWDTRTHRPHDPKRVNPRGQPYPPFHDVQVAVDGEAAAALGELARERWRRAGGRPLRPSPATADPWPSELKPDLKDVTVAIARTQPAWKNHPQVSEIETLHLDAIRAARRWIYIENQYLTAASVGDALADRLREPKGPEIVVVQPRECSGWLEELTMGVLRARLLRRLRHNDHQRHLRVLHPVDADGGPINVHAKVMVIDDALMLIGSANLNNRSMGLDSECGLVIEAADTPAIEAAIAAFRNGLVAEHLAVSAEDVAHTLADTGSLAETIHKLGGDQPRLLPLDGEVEPWVDELVPASAVIDPERPVDVESLVEYLLPEDLGESARHRLTRVGLILVALFLVAAAWRWSPLYGWTEPLRVAAWIEPLRDSLLAPVITVAAFTLGSLLVVPVTILIVLAAMVFGPWLGAVYALLGSFTSASLNYLIGRLLWRDTVVRLAGGRISRLSRTLARRGVLAMIAVRLLPVAPFTVVNLVAGSSHLRYRDFALGTLIGMSPGIFGLAVFSDQAIEAIRSPGAGTVATAAIVLVLFALTTWWLRRLLRTGAAPAEPPK
jgi:phospholipase D1/2